MTTTTTKSKSTAKNGVLKPGSDDEERGGYDPNPNTNNNPSDSSNNNNNRTTLALLLRREFILMISISRPRLMYISLFAWISVTGGRFLAPFLEHEGNCSESAKIGLILAAQYGIMGILSPFWGALADRFEQQQSQGRGYVLMGGVLVGTIAFLAHGLYRIVPTLPLLQQWWYHGLVHCFYATCFAIIGTVLDGMTVDYLMRKSSTGADSTNYGKERLWGAVSWGVTNLIFGPLIDAWGYVVYYPCAIITAIFSIITIHLFMKSNNNQQEEVSTSTNTATTPTLEQPRHEHQETNINNSQPNESTSLISSKSPSSPPPNASSTTTTTTKTTSTLSLVVLVFGTTAYGASFGLCYFLLNTGFSVVENLVFLFLEFLGGSYTIMAITVAITVLFEIPMFFVAPKLLRLKGTGWLLLLACGTYWIRVVGYTIIPTGQPAWVFAVEWLHGFTYAGAQSAAVEYVTQQMPVGMEASGQGIVNLVRGLASIVGLYAGGALQDVFGPRIMYGIFVVLVSIGMIIFALVRCQFPEMEDEEAISRRRQSISSSSYSYEPTGAPNAAGVPESSLSTDQSSTS